MLAASPTHLRRNNDLLACIYAKDILNLFGPIKCAAPRLGGVCCKISCASQTTWSCFSVVRHACRKTASTSAENRQCFVQVPRSQMTPRCFQEKAPSCVATWFGWAPLPKNRRARAWAVREAPPPLALGPNQAAGGLVASCLAFGARLARWCGPQGATPQAGLGGSGRGPGGG